MSTTDDDNESVNLRDEMLKEFPGNGAKILCAYIEARRVVAGRYGLKYVDTTGTLFEAKLKRGHSFDDFSEFLDVLNREYHPYGEESDVTLNAIVWFTDGSWMERDYDEDDPTERWIHHITPDPAGYDL